MRGVRLTAAMALLFALPHAALAAEWKFPNLNPFSRPAPPPRKEDAWRAPSAKPNMLQSWNRNTRQFFSNVGDTLNPFNDGGDAPARSPSTTGVRRRYSGSPSLMKEPPAKPWHDPLTSWLRPKEEPKQPETVNEFLSLPSPKY